MACIIGKQHISMTKGQVQSSWDRKKKIEELKAQAEAAKQYREQKEAERKKRLDEIRKRDSERRQQVEERKRAILEAENERRDCTLRKNKERESRLGAMKRERKSIDLAFGSSRPHEQVSSSTLRVQRRSISCGNKIRATSTSATERFSSASRKINPSTTKPNGRDVNCQTRTSLNLTRRISDSRSGKVTPANIMTSSMPGRLMSTSSSLLTSGNINRRPLTRKTMPARITNTDVTSEDINNSMKENKPPVKSTPKKIAQTTPKRLPNLMSTSLNATSSRISSAEKNNTLKREQFQLKASTPKMLTKASSSGRLNKSASVTSTSVSRSNSIDRKTKFETVSKTKAPTTPKRLPNLMSTSLNATSSRISSTEKNYTLKREELSLKTSTPKILTKASSSGRLNKSASVTSTSVSRSNSIDRKIKFEAISKTKAAKNASPIKPNIMSTSMPGRLLTTSTTLSSSNNVPIKPFIRRSRPASITGSDVTLENMNNSMKENKPPVKSTPKNVTQTTPKRLPNSMSTSLNATSSRISSAEKNNTLKREQLFSKTSTPKIIKKDSSYGRLNKLPLTTNSTNVITTSDAKNTSATSPGSIMSTSMPGTPKSSSSTSSASGSLTKRSVIRKTRPASISGTDALEDTPKKVVQTSPKRRLNLMSTSLTAISSAVSSAEKNNTSKASSTQMLTKSSSFKRLNKPSLMTNSASELSTSYDTTARNKDSKTDLLTTSKNNRHWIQTEEEAKAALNEKRRQFREARRLAELEQQRLEEEKARQQQFGDEAPRLEDDQHIDREQSIQRSIEEERLEREAKERAERYQRVLEIMSRSKKGDVTSTANTTLIHEIAVL